MAAGDMVLSLIINAQDNATSIVAGLGTTLAKLASGNVLGAVAVAGAAVGAALVGAAKSAGDFQEGLTQLVTGAGEAQSNLKAVGDGMLQISTATGTSTKSLTDAMYLIESSGQHGAAGLQVLQTAAEGAKVGNADLATTANALTTILTDYHQPASAAVGDMNSLVTAVADGKTHMQDLASSMGSVLPLASSLGISFPQVAGAIAVMTNSGMDAQRASMNLANAIRSLAAPNAAAQKSMQEVGLSAQQLKDALTTQGLAGAIQLIEDHVGKTFPAGSVQAVEAFKKIMGGATGYNVALMLGGQNMSSYESNIKNITAAMNAGGNSVQGWAMVQEDFNFRVSQAQAALQAMMITLGQQLLPVFGKVVDGVTQAVSSFTAWENQTHFVENALNVVVGALGLLGQGLSQVMNVLGQLWSLMEPFFTDLTKASNTWGQNFMSGFAQGIMAVAQDVVNAVEQVAQEIADYLGFASPTKKGPGSKLHQWGKGMVSGLVQGITSSIPLVSSAVTQVAGTLAGVANPAATGTAGLPAASTSSMVDKLTGDTRKVTVTPEVTQASGAVKQGSATLTSNLSTGIASGASAVKSAVSTVGKQIQSLCHTHAQSTSACAAHHLTTGLASKVHANAHHVAAAAHHVGAQTKHVATHAATHAATAAHHLTHGLASKVKASAPAVAGATGAVAGAISKGLQPIQQAANNVANSFKPISQAASSVAGAVTNALSPVASKVASVFRPLGSVLQGIGQWFRSSVIPALQAAAPGFQSLAKGVIDLIGALAQLVAAAGIAALRLLAPVVAALIPLVIRLAGIVAGVLGAAFSALATGISQVVNFFEKNQVAADALLIPLGAVSAILVQMAATAIVAFIASVPAVIAGFIAWATAAGAAALATLAATWPILAIGAVVGLVIAGIVLAVQHWGQISAWLQAQWKNVASFFGGLWKNITGFFGGVGKWFQDRFTEAKNGIQKAMGNVGSWFGDRWKDITNAAKTGATNTQNVFTSVTNWMQSAWNGAVQGVANAFIWLYQHNYYFKDLVDTIEKVLQALFTWMQHTWTTVTSWLTNLWNGIKTKASEIWKAISSTVSTLVSGAISALQTAWTDGLNWLTQQWDNLQTLAADAWKAISKVFSDAWTTYIATPLSKLWSNISGWWNTTTTNVGNAAKKLWTGVQTIFNTIWTTYIVTPLSKLWTSISTWFTQLAANCLTWAQNAMKQFMQGITNGASGVMQAITNLGQNILKFLGFHSPPAQGPLASSGTWMPNMMTMFAQGITQNSGKVTGSVQTVAQGINQQFGILNQQVTNNVNQTNTKINTLGSNFQTVGQNVRTSMSLLSSQMQLSAATINNSLTTIGTQATQTSSQVQKASNTLGQSVTTTSNTVVQANQIITQSSQQTDQAHSTLKSHFTQNSQTMQQDATKTAGVVKQSAKDAQAAWDAWMQHGNAADDAFAKAFNELFKGQLPKALDAFKQAFEETGKTLLAEAQTLAAKISGLLGHSKPTTGPLKDDDVWGKHFIENIVSGMQAGMPALNTVTNQIANKLALAYPTAQSNSFALPSNSASSQVPQQVNLQVNLDGKAIMKQMGIRMAHEIRVQGNVRGV